MACLSFVFFWSYHVHDGFGRCGLDCGDHYKQPDSILRRIFNKLLAQRSLGRDTLQPSGWASFVSYFSCLKKPYQGKKYEFYSPKAKCNVLTSATWKCLSWSITFSPYHIHQKGVYIVLSEIPHLPFWALSAILISISRRLIWNEWNQTTSYLSATQRPHEATPFISNQAFYFFWAEITSDKSRSKLNDFREGQDSPCRTNR